MILKWFYFIKLKFLTTDNCEKMNEFEANMLHDEQVKLVCLNIFAAKTKQKFNRVQVN